MKAYGMLVKDKAERENNVDHEEGKKREWQGK